MQYRTDDHHHTTGEVRDGRRTAVRRLCPPRCSTWMFGSVPFINGNTSHIAARTTTDCTPACASFRPARSNERATRNDGRLGERIEIVIGIGIRLVSDINSRVTRCYLVPDTPRAIEYFGKRYRLFMCTARRVP